MTASPLSAELSPEGNFGVADTKRYGENEFQVWGTVSAKVEDGM